MNRGKSDSMARNEGRRIREQELDRLETGPIICAFYLGRLWDGTPSPGYVPAVPPDNRPGVYVVEAHVLSTLNLADTVVNSGSFKSIAEEVSWADRYVRLVYIDHMGLPASTILDQYVVYIDCPLRHATKGTLMPRKGLSKPFAAVPEGTNQDESALLRMADPATKLIDKMRLGRARYGTSERPTVGVPLQSGGFQFPSPGERWR